MRSPAFRGIAGASRRGAVLRVGSTAAVRVRDAAGIGDGASEGAKGLRGLIRVTIRNGETPEKLLQRFKRTVAKEGLLKEIKKRNYYEKPSEARRRRAREQEKLLRKKARKKVIKDLRRKRRR